MKCRRHLEDEARHYVGGGQWVCLVCWLQLVLFGRVFKMKDQERHAAVSLIERDGKLLCVYNRRYEGWTLPGGLVEEGETNEQGQERELREETGLRTKSARLAWSGIHSGPRKEGRASIVNIYVVEAEGEPEAAEPGCPIQWMTRAEFLGACPFAETYKRIFAELG